MDFLDTVAGGIENAVGAVLAPVADTAGGAAATLRRELTRTWHGVFGSPTMPGGTNWNAYSHEELYAMVHDGADPGQVGEQAAVLDGLGRGAAEAADDLSARRGQVGEVWAGQASSAFGSTLGEHSAGGAAVAEHAAALSAAVLRASEALSRAQATMPHPVDVAAATAYGAAAPGPNFALGAVTGAGASWFAASLAAANKKAEAVEVMQAFEASLNAADPPDAPAKLPPGVPGGVPLPAPRPEVAAVAAAASIPRPATPARTTRATAARPAGSTPAQTRVPVGRAPATATRGLASGTPAPATTTHGPANPGPTATPTPGQATLGPAATPGPASITHGPANPGQVTTATLGQATPGPAATPGQATAFGSASRGLASATRGQATTTHGTANPGPAATPTPGQATPGQAATPGPATTFGSATSGLASAPLGRATATAAFSATPGPAATPGQATPGPATTFGSASPGLASATPGPATATAASSATPGTVGTGQSPAGAAPVASPAAVGGAAPIGAPSGSGARRGSARPSGWASGPDGRASGRPVAWHELTGRGGVPGLLADADHRPARAAATAVPVSRREEDREHHNRMPRADKLFALDDTTPPPVIGA
ncbi:hypothetical protein [Actinophytocola sp. KF-1]